MEIKKKRKINNQSGAAMMIIVIFFIFISLAIIAGLVSPVVREFNDASMNLKSVQSYYLAESGSEDLAYRALVYQKSVPDGTYTLTLNGATESTSLVTVLGSNGQVSSKTIVSQGNIQNLDRNTTVVLAPNIQKFKYVTQIGTGGIYTNTNMGTFYGSVYSSGSINAGTNAAIIAGTAISSTSILGSSNTSNPPTFTIGNGGKGIAAGGYAQAPFVQSVSASGPIYCTTSSNNNKSCTSSSYPTNQGNTYAISTCTGTNQTAAAPTGCPQTDVGQWEASAVAANNVHSGNWGSNTADNCIDGQADRNGPTPIQFGPGVINGNLCLTNAGNMYIKGVVWVHGSLNMSGGNPDTIKLDPTSTTNGVLIVDNGITIQDTGDSVIGYNSYHLLLVSNNGDMVTNNSPSFDLLFAPYNKITFNGSNVVVNTIVGAKSLDMENNCVINSNGVDMTGFSSQNFYTVPPPVVLTIGSWQESQ